MFRQGNSSFPTNLTGGNDRPSATLNGSRMIFEQLEAIRSFARVPKDIQQNQYPVDNGVHQDRQAKSLTAIQSNGLKHDMGLPTSGIDLRPININPYPVYALEPGQMG